MSKDSFESKCRPKCFWESVLLTGMFSMNFLSSLSAKNDFLNLLCRVRIEAHFPLEGSFISFRSLFRLLAVLTATLTVENRDVSSANNLGLH